MARAGYDAFQLTRLDFGDLGGEVQAVARLGPEVFVGVSDGREARLLHFRLPRPERVRATRLGGKRIEQLEVISGIRQLLVLVDGNVVQLAASTLPRVVWIGCSRTLATTTSLRFISRHHWIRFL